LKLQKIELEIQKIREKIAEQQEKLKTLEAQKFEMENLEIAQLVRSVNMTPAELSVLIQRLRNRQAIPIMENKEDTNHDQI
jgi:septal ring factor EnvC (AmiA/AmiB activator)